MKYDTRELFAEINAFRRRDMLRKIGGAAGIAAVLVMIWAVGLADLCGLFLFNR